jgi:branched-chain amino acid transport system ATP-binding protein
MEAQQMPNKMQALLGHISEQMQTRHRWERFMTSALEINNFNVSYGKVAVVRDVSLEVGEGSIVTLLGPNGAGKTSTVKGILGLATRSGGDVILFGERITTKKPHEMVRLGLAFVPQGRELFPHMSVTDNIELGAFAVHRKINVGKRTESILEYFPRLRDRRGQRAGSLSGGEQQMLAIARALISEPRVVILDEPSAGLAPQIVHQVFEIVKTIAKEERSSILIAEQNAHQALRIADYAYVLDSGYVSAQGTSEQLLADDSIRSAYLGEVGITRPGR